MWKVQCVNCKEIKKMPKGIFKCNCGCTICKPIKLES